MAEKIKVFVDSNVWFSAFYKKGVCSKLLEKLPNKKYEVVISEIVLEEIIKNIKLKLPSALPLVYDFFSSYPLIVIKNPIKAEIKQYQNLADKKDVPILLSAINYKCDYFITGNLKDFKGKVMAQKYNLKIISPQKALMLLF